MKFADKLERSPFQSIFLLLPLNHHTAVNSKEVKHSPVVTGVLLSKLPGCHKTQDEGQSYPELTSISSTAMSDSDIKRYIVATDGNTRVFVSRSEVSRYEVSNGPQRGILQLTCRI